MKEVIEVKRDDLRELYQVLTNYPAISKEQVQNEMHKVFGEDTFKPKDIMERVKTFEDACRELGEEHPEEEVVHALVGFIRQPQGRELLKRAASLSMLDSLMKSVLNAKEREERK